MAPKVMVPSAALVPVATTVPAGSAALVTLNVNSPSVIGRLVSVLVALMLVEPLPPSSPVAV